MSTSSSELNVEQTEPVSLFQRVRKALGPAVPGIALDLVDAMGLTLRTSPFVSFPLGLILGVWLSSYYPIALRWRALIALSSGLYTLTPGTEAIPLATILTCLGRFIEAAPESTSPMQTPAENFAAANSEATPETEPQTAPVTTRTGRSEAKCPECGSASLKYGQVGQRFWPQGTSIWSKGHEVNAFVCLDCGFLGHYLATDDLNRLEQSKS